MRFEAKLLVFALSLPGLAACTPVDPGLGEAVKYDMAIQTVNPDPVYPEDGAQPGDNGEKGATAVKNYRKGEAKSLRVMSTSSGASGGGGSGGTPSN